ncbi:protein mono-ADP-ribosyltransferase PARP14-like isoform X2 [Catharus ustulatus]|uniref:protein mono-ADP-ribosyltransferase PARP14-like isoform X2 n=1 Tax=Catharus ustulatus TaxID=91951 RepID=UPI00140C361F|nr:protein mono-ADP-ribosyltransferase PARP14-like isoform X2 [Catharus ustulatus]
MERQGPSSFPVLVRGDWGPTEPPPALRKKLLCYFQSHKRSGGGECELRTGTGTGHIIVCFTCPEVKQRVLERQSHELHLGGEGKLRLIVTEPETALATKETLEEKSVPTKALDAMSSLQTKDDTKTLKKTESFVPNSELQEEVDSAEASPSVVLENIERCCPKTLHLLLENISDLHVDADFTVELIPEKNVAVVTFIKSIDAKEFVKKCSQHKRVREFKMTARVLESTQSIKVENLPDSISTDYLTLYFENARNGGAAVSDVQFFPEENSAIITFCDHKDLTMVLEKQHLLDQTLISVYPYYHSLGTALYGKERPAVKMPDPIGVPLDPYVWQFLQRHANLTQDINQEMAVCHAELQWPQADCASPEVMLCPSPSLCKQKKPMMKLLKTWQQDASAEFSRIMACYIAIKCEVSSSGWEDVKKRLSEDAVIITDVSEGMVVIAGNRAAVDSAEKEVRKCMKQSEREKQSIEISVPVIPGKYAVLYNAGLEESIQKEYPSLKLFYDDKKKTVQLYGLPAEVYKIKSDLLEKLSSMPCTSVTIDPHVFHYLQSVDNKKTSDMLFIREKINAFYELQDESVLLYGDAPKDLQEAEKRIKTDLEYKCINVEDGEVVKKDQWKNLLSSIQTYNSSQEIVITWQSIGKENKMIIAGFSKSVTEVYQRLNAYVDRNTVIEKAIPVTSVVNVQFVENMMSGVCKELKKKGVTVHFNTKTPCISLRGPRAELPEALMMFEKIVSSLYSRNVPIDKPGAKEFFIERKDLCVLEAKQKFNCFIRIKEEEHKGRKVDDKVKRKVYYEKSLPGGIVIGVYRGNLCDYPVDVVVNASNEDLRRIGGLADALSRAAGPALQQECDELVRKLGNLEPGRAVITGAGKLPCKNVIHAVGPRWNEKESQKCTWLLKKAVKQCLQLAKIYNHRSIALPAISGGVFGFPPQVCADSIVSSIKETLEELMEGSSLKEIHLVSNSEEIVQALSEAVKKVFSAKSSSPKCPMMKKSQKENRKGDLKMITTNEGLCICVEKKNVQEATTDVVVNSVGTDLKFGVGPLCVALLGKAGPALKAQFDIAVQSQAAGPGSVLCTSGCDMACKSMFHAILPKWKGGQTEKVLEDVINFCLEKTEELGLKSIAFPAIWTGGFGFPKTIVSKLMFDLAFRFSSCPNRKNLQEVHFLLSPQDIDSIQAFTTELELRADESCNAAAAQPSCISPVSAEVLGVHEMRIGSITAISGDITKEDTEVIVNISNSSFDAKTVNEPQVSVPICQKKETPVCTEQEKTESCEKLEAEKSTSSNSAVVVTTAFGEKIEDEILEMYFENKRKSGGGNIESYVKKDEQVIITFEKEQDAQEVLQRKHHLNKIDLVVRPWQVETSQGLCQVENSEGSLLPTAVVLENVKETVKDCILVMLVENISGLSEDGGDFSVEMIPELCAAVVTFTGNTDAKDFAKKFNQNPRARKQNITARCLERTKSVRAENVPPNTPSHYLTVYFENEKYGGAQTVDVQLLPDEDAAIITFGDQKDVTNILAKKHSLNKTPIFVYPYYTSLETALYGKEGPQIKKPDPITWPLDPYIWTYLKGNSSLIEAIDDEMAKCNCVLTWPDPLCADPKVTLHPSAIFDERKRSVSRLAKTWKEEVSTAFSHSISQYEAIQCLVSTEVWEAIRDSFPHEEVMMIPHISEDLHVLVGEKEVVKKVEQELKLLIQKATREIEREKQRTELKVTTVNPGEYGILQITGLEEKFHKEFPDLQITYDYFQKCINLSGVPEEVYKVKGEILDHVHKMAKKTINIHPYILQFLEHVDNETLSQSLFVSKQISAFYELGAGGIILKASDPEDLLKAEEEIKKDLDHKSITLDDKSVLQKEKWWMLAKEACCNGAVSVTVEETQVVIAGLSEAVAKAFEELYNFIDENTQVQRIIEGKPMALIKFFEKEKVNDWTPLQKKGVKVDFRTQKNGEVISLSGPKTKVLEGVSLVDQILSGLHFKRVEIDLPGAKAYIKEQEQFLYPHIKQVFKCLVLLEEQPEKHLEEQKGHSNRGKLCMQVTMGETLIALYEADLCTHPVDVVVNASHEDLRHIGGLAEALSRAAGPALQQECDELVRKLGNLEPGRAVITGAGKLPCKNVIHAVGPRWNEKESQKCTWLLKKTVKQCLQLAEIYNHRSIALPAISGGIFGFPLDVCTYTIVSSIKETLEEFQGNTRWKEIHLVGFAQDNIQAFRKAFKEVFPDSLPSYRSPHHASPVPRPRQSKRIKNFPVITTLEGLNIMLQIGSIEDATTSIVVVSVGRDLQLDKGLLGRALLSKAGPMLQTGLLEEGGGRAEEGSVLKTKGYNLACSVVLHAVVPAWSQKNTPSKVLGDIITKCLEIAEELSLKSITFPAIGTGNLGFPRSVVAKLLFDKVFEFSSKNKVNSLEEVHFLLHTKDTATIQEFSAELENMSVSVEGQKPSSNDTSQSLAFSAVSSTSAHNVLEVTIGSLVFRVAEGDITKEEGDAIINITNVSFNLKKGVSKAILNGAGKAVEDECAVARQTGNNYVITQGGNLPCKNIIHFVAQDDIKSLVSQVLQECELQQYTSVTFPAIGTGEARRNPAEAADSMIDAVTDFAKRNSATSVKTVKVVIFQPHLMSVFQASMQKREKSTATIFKSLVSKAYHMGKSLLSSDKRAPKEKTRRILAKKIDLAVLQICGEDKKEVEEAEKWLRSAICREQSQTEIVDEFISHFSEEENEELDDLQKKFKISLSSTNTSIKISGVAKDVYEASLAVHEMIRRVKCAKEDEAKLLQNSVEWNHFEKDSYEPFYSLTNVELENAYKGKQKSIEVTIGEKKYTVDMDNKTAVDAQGGQIAIIRIDKSEDQKSIVLPPTWDPMENERVKIVELKPDSKEYKDVQEKFLQTCQSFKIEKIERVQNRYLWKSYQIKKCEMDQKNGDKNNERLLFHGTSQESLTFINDHGFYRSYAGMHAPNFGNGTYFAVNASYSAYDIYSKPDANGKKYMYLARVLVGEYSLGKKGSVTPARKDVNNSVDLFDSSTDNINQPSMFIIFNDIQAYPEYLITFTK